ncbi:fatty acid--CoA ligase family protein [Myxococcota bacterium]|nr:fatty acid--CoA ligase family protein [Myxococcota bacterium]
MDLAQRIRTVLTLDPDAQALEFENHWYSWSEVSGLIGEIEQILDDADLGQDTAVAVLLRNRPALLGAFFALLISRRCLLTLNPIQGESKLSDELLSLRPPALVASTQDWALPGVRAAAAEVGCLGIEVSDAPHLQARLLDGLASPGPGPHHPELPGVAVQMLTSGTTGPPKRIPLRFDALDRSLSSATRYESGGAGEQTPTLRSGVVLMPNPMVHVGGIFRAGGAYANGRRIALMERFDVAAWQERVVRHEVKAASLVPAALKMVLDADLPRSDLASLRMVSTGTAPLDPDTADAFEARYGVPVLTTYGATEFAGGVAGWTLKDHREFGKTKRGSSGRANQGVALRVVDPETGIEVAPGTRGLLEVKTHQHSDETPTHGESWVRTTDLSSLDEDGFLWIHGRADGAINRGGFKLQPREIEQVLETHPSVREASVVGIPDDRLGEVPVAALVPIHRETPLDLEALARFAREHLTGYQVPTQFLAVEELPRTPSMKVSQPGVRQLFEPQT